MKKRFFVKVIVFVVLAALLTITPLIESAANINVLSITASAATTCRRITLTQSEYNTIINHWNNKGVSYLGYDLYPSSEKKLAVIDMQNLLNKVMDTDLTLDGQYGSASQAAVKNFQRSVEISEDGLFGNVSFNKLMSYIDITNTPTSSQSVPSFDGKSLYICSALNRNLVFDVEGGNSPQNETNICVYENHHGQNQIFRAKIVYTDSSGKAWYKLYPLNDYTGKYALNVNYGGNYNNLQTYSSSGLCSNELFAFEPDGNGTCHISAYCGGYLEVSGNYDTANVFRREGSKQDSTNQQFYIDEATAKLDLNAALDYAKTYWNRLDPANGFYMSNGTKTYDASKFSSSGNNCANYVSACILAAGLNPDSTWYRGSMAWINVNSMRDYFTSKGIKYISSPSASQIEAGDVIYTSAGHVMFVTSAKWSGNRKIIKATGNTNSRDINFQVTSFYGVLKTSSLFN